MELEKNYKAEQQLEKDRRMREQKAYRDYLFTQMNERKARETHKNWQDKVYIENRYRRVFLERLFFIKNSH